MPSVTAKSLAYRTDETLPINPSRRNKEVSRQVEPVGIEQQEEPHQQHQARDQTNHPRAYPRPQDLDPGHDPLVVDAQGQDEHQDQRSVANKCPRRMGGEDKPDEIRPSGDHHERDERRIGYGREGEEHSRAGQGE